MFQEVVYHFVFALQFDFNPIGWAYVIAASWIVAVSCCMVLLALLNVESMFDSHVVLV